MSRRSAPSCRVVLPRRSRARPPRPRPCGRTSARRAARTGDGPPATSRSSPPAPRGSRPARSRAPVRAPRRRRGSPRSRPRPPPSAAPRRSRAASAPGPGARSRPEARRARRRSPADNRWMTTGAEAALSEFRRTRRRRYVEDLDVMEILYRVYLVLIFGGIALAFIAGIVSEAPVSASALEDIRAHGAADHRDRGRPRDPRRAAQRRPRRAAGDRAGRGPVHAAGAARPRRGAAAGGVQPAADRRDRRRRGRRGRRQLRLPALPGLGARVDRLPGAVRGLVPVCVLGGALLGSGRRLRPWAAALGGAGLVAWSAADLALGSTTSPTTMLGELATLPLQHGTRVVLAAAGVTIAVALIGVGLLGVGGILLEAARRRASLAAELRFSASVRTCGPSSCCVASSPPSSLAAGRGCDCAPAPTRSGVATGRACCAGRRCGSSGSWS